MKVTLSNREFTGALAGIISVHRFFGGDARLEARNGILSITAVGREPRGFLRVTLPAEVEAEGKVIVSAPLLKKLPMATKGNIVITVDGAEITYKTEKTELKGVCRVAGDARFIATVDVRAEGIVVRSDEFKRAGRAVMRLVIDDEMRPTGIFLEPKNGALYVMGTNLYRFGRVRVEGTVGDFTPVVIPAPLLRAFLFESDEERELSIVSTGKFVELHVPGVTLLIEDPEKEWFNWGELYKRREVVGTLWAHKASLVKRLKEVERLAGKTPAYVPLHLEQRRVFFAQEDMVMHLTPMVVYSGEKLVINLRVQDLLDVLAGVSTKNVTLDFAGPLKAVRVSGEEFKEDFLVMPFREGVPNPAVRAY